MLAKHLPLILRTRLVLMIVASSVCQLSYDAISSWTTLHRLYT